MTTPTNRTYNQQSPSNQHVSNKPHTLSVGVSVEQARATVWPFRPYRGQTFGVLLDNKQLSLRDLGFAAESAWDIRVRQAAVTLALARLNQVVKEPDAPAGFLHVVSGGRSFAQRRQYQFTFLEGTLLGFGLGVCIVVAIWSFSSGNPHAGLAELPTYLASPSGVVGLLIALAACVVAFALPYFLLDKITARLDKEIDSHLKGEEGEDAAARIMSQVLDGNWFLFRNILLPGRQHTDLDAVLVGPPGVWVLEIKFYTREHRNIGEHWEYRSGNRWKLLRESASRQATSNAVRLANFLRADGVQQWITPTVVWANPECPLTVENPSETV